jgi:DNA-directed RNA polymerase specialized sigma24 family protein
VESCFESLPETLRAPCRLYYYEDQQTPRIAEILEVALDTVRKRLERARDGIRECFEKTLGLENA